jgi:translation initiation factor IF-2
MCGAVLNARKHRTTPLVKPRTSLCASHLSTHATPLAPRARDCTVSPRTLPAHHRPQASCVVRGHVPSSSTRAPSPSPATAPTAPAGVGRRRRPRPTPSPGTAAPPSARGGATSAGAHRDLPAVTAAGACGRRGDGDGAPVEGAGSMLPTSLPLGGTPLHPRRGRRQRLRRACSGGWSRTPHTAPQRLRQRGESRWSVGLRRRPEPPVGVMRDGAPGGPRPMSYVAT